MCSNAFGECITVALEEEALHYPCFELLQQFAPSARIVFDDQAPARLRITRDADSLHFEALLSGTRQQQDVPLNGKPLEKEAFKGFLYLFLTGVFGRTLDWGTLTGIKPVKLAHRLMAQQGLSAEAAARRLSQLYDVSPKKARLAAGMASRELPVVYPLDPKRVSVYLGIPLCPARCAYCSFVTTVADGAGETAAAYLENLLLEIDALGDLVRRRGLTVDTLYIGGGTPSILTPAQLERLFAALEGPFIHPKLREFTFEAGRPETTDRAKLALMKAAGAGRVCLNPQSMNDDTLKAVGRNHTAEDIRRVYGYIRETGFDCVNMDLILGLNREAPEAFLRSLDAVIAMAPENLTVHSLAIKKGSVLQAGGNHRVEQLYGPDFYEAVEERIARGGYLPYYLYRQKYTQGNGENTGYTRPGHAGIYNILMMAEKQTIIGIGAGSSGKVYEARADRFHKVFTAKDIKTYNDRIHEIIADKLLEYEGL